MFLLTREKLKKKIVMCILYSVKEAQRGVNSCYFVVFGLSRKTVIFSSAAAFNTSFLNPCYRDWRIYMMQLLLRIPLLSEDRLFSNLSSKLKHDFSQNLAGSHPGWVQSLSQPISWAHIIMGGEFSALLYRLSHTVAHSTFSKHCVNVNRSSWHLRGRQALVA